MARKVWPFQRHPTMKARVEGMDTVSGACGLGCIEGFVDDYGVEVSALRPTRKRETPWSGDGCGGTGYTVAAFIDEPACNQIYRDIKKYHKIVFQSDVRLNNNSGNQFFFVIFDTNKETNGRSQS